MDLDHCKQGCLFSLHLSTGSVMLSDVHNDLADMYVIGIPARDRLL